MRDDEIATGAVSDLPDEELMKGFKHKVGFWEGIKIAREQARRGEGTPIEEMPKLVKVWARRSS